MCLTAVFCASLTIGVAGCGGSEPLVTSEAVPRGPLTGRVVDGSDGQPVAGATVFVGGTTHQTTAGDDGTFRIPNVPVGGYTVGTYLPGYAPTMTTISHDTAASQSMRLTLSTGYGASEAGERAAGDSTSANDVPPATARRLDAMRQRIESLERRIELLSRQIRLLRKEQRGTQALAMNRKDLDRFKEFFLGANREKCSLLNPGELSFERPDTGSRVLLRATADQPLEVLNRDLGYRVRIVVSEFTVFKYRGEHAVSSDAVLSFEPMTPNSEEMAEQWRERRQEAYFGSRTHLLQALGAERTEDEQFTFARPKQVKRRRSETIGGGTYTQATWVRVGNVARHVVPIETTPGETPYLRRLDLNGRYQIQYAGEREWRLVVRGEGSRFTVLGQPLVADAFGAEKYWQVRPVCRRVPTDYLPPESS